MTRSRLGWLAAGLSFVLLYQQIMLRLVHDWYTDDNYSHGFFVVPLALYFLWERRDRLRTTPVRPSVFGLLVVAGGLAMLVAGLLGAELFLTRASLIVVLGGAALFVLGWPVFRELFFPLAFLILMVPIPAIIFNQIAFPLQLLASRVGELTLSGLNIPVLREGNVIILSNTTLEVAEACSGIRSLISLLTLGIVYGYFSDPRPTVRLLIAALTIPIAIVANAVRVAGTGVAAHYYGAGVAEGFLHTFSGWLLFIAAFGMVFVVTRLLLWLVPRRNAGVGPAAVVAV